MKIKLLLTATLFAVVIFVSCNNNKEQASQQDLQSVGKIELKEPPPGTQTGNKQKFPSGPITQSTADTTTRQNALTPTTGVDWDKKIIKTATLKLEVNDFNKYNESVHKTVKQFGGYIAQEEQNLTDEKTETTISIKVPVNQFETMMNQLPGAGVKVLERKIHTEDVTGQVVDVKSRLEAKKQVRLKYLDFLKQSKNMEEVLQVQGEINGLQEEIESAAGRVAYLAHQSAMSTIHLSFYQPINGYKPSDGTPSFLVRTADAFKFGAKWIADLLVGLIGLWPLMIIILGGIFIFKKRFPAKKQTA